MGENVRVLYLLSISYVIPRVRLYGPRYSVWSQLNLLPLNHLDYQLIYAAHHLYPSFLLYTGIRRNRALAKYNSRTSEKIKSYTLDECGNTRSRPSILKVLTDAAR